MLTRIAVLPNLGPKRRLKLCRCPLLNRAHSRRRVASPHKAQSHRKRKIRRRKTRRQRSLLNQRIRVPPQRRRWEGWLARRERQFALMICFNPFISHRCVDCRERFMTRDDMRAHRRISHPRTPKSATKSAPKSVPESATKSSAPKSASKSAPKSAPKSASKSAANSAPKRASHTAPQSASQPKPPPPTTAPSTVVAPPSITTARRAASSKSLRVPADVSQALLNAEARRFLERDLRIAKRKASAMDADEPPPKKRSVVVSNPGTKKRSLSPPPSSKRVVLPSSPEKSALPYALIVLLPIQLTGHLLCRSAKRAKTARTITVIGMFRGSGVVLFTRFRADYLNLILQRSSTPMTAEALTAEIVKVSAATSGTWRARPLPFIAT